MAKIYINPLPVRVWHWINALGFVVLILTGLNIRYADVVALMSFATAVRVHNAVGFILIANYLVWLGFYLFTDKIIVYHPELDPRKYFRDSLRQMLYYGYGIFRGEPNPHHATAYRKFNALQSLTYQIVMILLVPIQFYTGVLLWDLERFRGSIELFGGVRVVATVHVLLFIFFTGFVFVHAYLASLSAKPFAHFKAMITGYEELDEKT
ncbi:MAG TPA: cytochrome b/b6 domain-containing protein [Burkholderiales bacterium]|nr:cytochrome b/b6 domain-containing protein [Burkholderiales bacterium]